MREKERRMIMAKKGKLNELIDVDAVKKQFDTVEGYVDDLIKKINDAKPSKDFLKDAVKPSEIMKGIDDVDKKQQQQIRTTKQLTSEQAKLNLQVAEANKQTKLNAVLENSIAGSIGEHRAQIKLLTAEREKLNIKTEEGKQRLVEINSELNAHNFSIQSNLDLDGQRIANIGNYNGQLGVLSKALRGIGGLGEIVAKAVGISPEAFASIREAGLAIRDLRHINEGGELFQKTGTDATIAYTSALERNNDKLREAGVVIEEVHHAKEVSSTAIKGETVIIGTNAAAEKVNTNATKENAVIEEVNTEAVHKNTSAQKINTTAVEQNALAQKVNSNSTKAKLKDLVNTAPVLATTTAATEVNTVATEANAAASTTAAKSTGFFTKALDFLKGNPLILTLTALVAVGAAIAYFVFSADDGSKSASELADEELNLAKSVKEANDEIQDQIDILNDDFGSGLDLLKSQLQLLEKQGASQEKLFAKKKEIALAESDLNDNVLQAQIKRAENEDENFTRSITGYDALNNAIEKHREKAVDAANELVRLDDRKRQGLLNSDELEAFDKKKEALKATLDTEKKIFNDYYGAAKKSFDSTNALDELDAEHKKQLSEEARKRAEADAKALFEIFKLQQERLIDLDKETISNDKAHLSDRLLALNDYANRRQSIIDETARIELLNAKLTAKEIELIEEKRIDASLRLTHELSLGIQKAYKDFKDTIPKIEIAVDGMTKSIAKAIDEIKKKNDELKDGLEKNAKSVKDAVKTLLDEVQGLIFDLFTASIERQKNGIQDQIDLLDKKKEKDIEVANQTINNEQQKANAIAIIEARADAQKEGLERKKRQLAQQEAKFQKAQSIAAIIESTAQAVIGALAQVKTIGPAATALAVIYGAIGAVQLARVLATPIPKYKHGIQDHPGGLAEVGHGKEELVQTPSGKLFKTPWTPTLTYLPKHSKVFPDAKETLKMMAIGIHRDNERAIATADTQTVFNDKNITDEIKAMRYDIVKAIRKIPQAKIKTSDPMQDWLRNGQSNEWMRRNLNG